MSNRDKLTKLAVDHPELRVHLVPLLREAAGTAPLKWSVDWSMIMDRILATYPITETSTGWSITDQRGKSATFRSREKAVGQAVAWFVDGLKTVARGR